MKKITRAEIKNIAKKYGRNPDDIIDYVIDMESDGIVIDADDVEDMIVNGDM